MQIQETIIDGIVYKNFIYEESDMATQSEKDSWLSVCNTCEFKQDDRCGSCGCILESIMAYKTATCPAGKWLDMALFHGQASTLVTSVHVYGVSVNSATINSGDTGNIGSRGGYQLSVTHDNVGCGGTGVLLELNDLVPWSNITFEVYLTSVTSCWSFCTGNYVTAGGGNILSYNEGNGDRISRAFNSWELPQFQTHNRESACDNDSNNFFHGSFAVGDPKKFFMKRRRNVNGSRGGIALGRACTGAPGLTIIRNIRIW